jgi:aldehyde dehydrogenase
MMGTQTSLVQEKSKLYQTRKEEGQIFLIGGEENKLEGDLEGGYYIKPTAKDTTKCVFFGKEIFGPVLASDYF